jgi:hypothetical protein
MARPVGAKPFDFDTLPIQLRDMTDTVPLMTKAAMLFHNNLKSSETQKALEAMVPAGQLTPPVTMPDERLPIFIVFDLMFVALRRTVRSPAEFVVPIQGVYASMQQKNADAAARAGDSDGGNRESPTGVSVSEPEKGFWRRWSRKFR